MGNDIRLIDSGIFVASKKMNCKICLEDKNENSSQFIDYFLFSNMLFAKFDEDKVKKILTILNEGDSLLLDFSKGRAFKINKNEANFFKEFSNTYMNKNKVLEDYLAEVNDNQQEVDINTLILTKYSTGEV